MAYFFLFGRTPALALLELKTFFPNATSITDAVAHTDENLRISPQEFLNRLGGTVKIAEVLGTVAALTPGALAPFIDSSGSVVFGVSLYGGTEKLSRSFLQQLKDILAQKKAHIRFVEPKHEHQLSSVVVTKHHVWELVVVKKDNRFLIGKTVAVQPFETWGARDRGRPFADASAGMLPLKVARMIVNIADSKRNMGDVLAQKTLLDPFCGMGTILGEALLMGWNVVGGDQSSEVIAKTRTNLAWLLSSFAPTSGVTYRLHVSDAVHSSQMVDASSIDAIVTEPFMGSAAIGRRKEVNRQTVRNTIKGLEKLYIGCLKDWHGLLKPNAKIIIALPAYAVGGETYFVKKAVDMCENLGYTILVGPIEYSRPQAVVRREFYVFQKV